jgi:hypothetical protein
MIWGMEELDKEVSEELLQSRIYFIRGAYVSA